MLYLNYCFYIINKKLRVGFISAAGRNFSGRICVYHRSGGHKRNSYRVDFYKRLNCFGVILKIIKTSFYSSFVGLILYENGFFSYQLLAENAFLYKRLYSGFLSSYSKLNTGLCLGYSVGLLELNLFSVISHIELMPYRGIQYLRAAGTGGILTLKSDKVSLKLKSG